MYGRGNTGSDRTSKNSQELLHRSFRLAMIVLTILLSDLSFLTFTEAATPTPPPFRNSSSPHPSSSTSFASSTSSSTGGTGVESRVEATDFVGTPMCRDRDGYFPPKDFELWSCGYCLNYLYNVTLVRVVFHDRLRLLLFTNGTKQIIGTGLPDVTNATDVSKVCKALQAAGQDCQRWVDCCRAAQDCCRRQRAASASLPALGKLGMDRGAVLSDGKYCPATWDGYRCWDRTPAGSTVSTHCASYIEHASTDGRGSSSSS